MRTSFQVFVAYVREKFLRILVNFEFEKSQKIHRGSIYFNLVQFEMRVEVLT